MSLRLRLLAGAVAAIFVALALSWLGLSLLFDRHVERGLQQELTRHGLQIAGQISLTSTGEPLLASPPSDLRFDTPASGLYWQVSTAAGRARSRSLWDQAISPGTAPAQIWTVRREAGPFGQRIMLVERTIHFDRDARAILIQVGANLAMLERERADFGRELALSLALLWAVLSGAAWSQVWLGLRPLDGVRRDLSALRRDARARLDRRYPREIAPLTQAINALAAAREADLTRARRRAADLAHGLKTPLSALAALARQVRDGGSERSADGLDRAVAAARAAIDAELGRARAGMARDGAGGSSRPRPVATRIADVLEHTEVGAKLLFDIEIADDAALPLAEEDVTDLLGAIVENAARHARRRVLISFSGDEDAALLSVEDDGPGIDEARTESVLRGGRLDEGGDGHGLGLAIARDIVEATGGTLDLGRSTLGGLSVTMRWPRQSETGSPDAADFAAASASAKAAMPSR